MYWDFSETGVYMVPAHLDAPRLGGSALSPLLEGRPFTCADPRKRAVSDDGLPSFNISSFFGRWPPRRQADKEILRPLHLCFRYAPCLF